MQAMRTGTAKNKKVAMARAAILVAGAALMLFGVFSGDCRRLFMKAVFVCMECAGIG